MLAFNQKSSAIAKSTACLVTALMVGTTVFLPLAPASAKPKSANYVNPNPTYTNGTQPTNNSSTVFPNRSTVSPNRSTVFPNRYSQTNTGINIPAGTTIPVIANDADTIKITKGESRSLSLNLNANLRSSDGTILIPAGTQVTGQLQATEQGVQYLAQQVIMPNGQAIPINATSRLLMNYNTEQIGASTADIVMGTLAGAGTATIIAGTTGDRHINALEVLGGAAAGALAGWGLPAAGILGGGSLETMTLNPSQDLTLTLQSPLSLNSVSSRYPSNSNNGYSNTNGSSRPYGYRK
ncbi:MAG: hypothetical protein ACRC6M_19270 [Microcystaceae cyanobacterium]